MLDLRQPIDCTFGEIPRGSGGAGNNVARPAFSRGILAGGCGHTGHQMTIHPSQSFRAIEA
jgi:hypothetical protein